MPVQKTFEAIAVQASSWFAIRNDGLFMEILMTKHYLSNVFCSHAQTFFHSVRSVFKFFFIRFWVQSRRRSLSSVGLTLNFQEVGPKQWDELGCIYGELFDADWPNGPELSESGRHGLTPAKKFDQFSPRFSSWGRNQFCGRWIPALISISGKNHHLRLRGKYRPWSLQGNTVFAKTSSNLSFIKLGIQLNLNQVKPTKYHNTRLVAKKLKDLITQQTEMK